MADRVVDRGEAVQVQEDDAGPPGHRGVAQHVPGALLDVGAVRQAGQPVVEGQVRDLLAQRDLVAHVAGGDEHLHRLTGRLVAEHGGLDVPPRPVGGPDPDREPAGSLGPFGRLTRRGPGQPSGVVPAEREPDRGQRGGPVLRVDEIEQPPADQRPRRVAVVLDRRARVPDRAVQIADQHHVAGPVGQIPQAPAGFPPDPEDIPVLPDEHEDPRGQHQHPGATRHDQRDPGGRRPGQAVRDHHQGGHARGQHGDDGRRRRAGVRRVQLAAVTRHGASAQQQRRDHRHQLRRDAEVAAGYPLAHGQGVADGDGEHGQVGQRDPPPRARDHGQQRAEHGQVGQRVDQGEQEGARPLARPVELAAEQRDPADHQQGDGHDVAVREPRQDRIPEPAELSAPSAPSGLAPPAAGAGCCRPPVRPWSASRCRPPRRPGPAGTAGR